MSWASCPTEFVLILPRILPLLPLTASIKFPFGTMYEIEIETVDAARAREIIEKVLREHAVDYTYSRFNKFVRMLRGTLSDDVEEGKARV